MQYKSIELLRIISAILVLIAHLPKDNSATYLFNGAIGVDLFFVISGFVIFQSWSNQTIGYAQSLKFAINRLFRVMPLYLFLIILLVLHRLRIDKSIDFSHLAHSIFLIPKLINNVYLDPIITLGWTLSFEIFFYMIVSFSLLLSKQAGFVFIILCIFISSIVASVNGFYFGSNIIFEFLFGFIFSYLIKKFNIIDFSLKLKFYLLIISFFLLILVSLGKETLTHIGINQLVVERMKIELGDMQFIRCIVWGIPSVFFIVSVVLLEKNFKWYFSFLGKYTYSFYLAQYVSIYIGQLLISIYFINQFTVNLIIFLLTSLFAFFSYKFIEVPFVNFGKALLKLNFTRNVVK